MIIAEKLSILHYVIKKIIVIAKKLYFMLLWENQQLFTLFITTGFLAFFISDFFIDKIILK